MRRLVATALLTPALFGSIITSPAAAAEGATPYNVKTCFTTFNQRLVCVADHGVRQTATNAAGGELFVFNGHSTLTVTDIMSGDEIVRVSTLRHFVSQGTTVPQAVLRETSIFDGQTCTLSRNFVLVNGEFRHNDVDYTCR